MSLSSSTTSRNVARVPTFIDCSAVLKAVDALGGLPGYQKHLGSVSKAASTPLPHDLKLAHSVPATLSLFTYFFITVGVITTTKGYVANLQFWGGKLTNGTATIEGTLNFDNWKTLLSRENTVNARDTGAIAFLVNDETTATFVGNNLLDMPSMITGTCSWKVDGLHQKVEQPDPIQILRAIESLGGFAGYKGVLTTNTLKKEASMAKSVALLQPQVKANSWPTISANLDFVAVPFYFGGYIETSEYKGNMQSYDCWDVGSAYMGGVLAYESWEKLTSQENDFGMIALGGGVEGAMVQFYIDGVMVAQFEGGGVGIGELSGTEGKCNWSAT